MCRADPQLLLDRRVGSAVDCAILQSLGSAVIMPGDRAKGDGLVDFKSNV
jgi:hypothetical protein